MSRNLKIIIVIAALLLMVVIVGLLAAYATTPPQQRSWPYGGQIVNISPSEGQTYLMARTIISTINISLLLVLVITYASIFLKTRSEFTIGLLIFALVFLSKDIASSPLLLGIFGLGMFGMGIGPFMTWFAILPDLFELAALSILLYLSVKY
jgi:hypothetical protein